MLRVAAGKPTLRDRERLSEAAARLAAHHGSCPPAMAPRGEREQKYADWFCGICKTKGGKPFRNFGFRTDCLQCGCRAPKGARKLKGQSESNSGGKAGAEGAAQRKLQEEVKALKARCKSLEAKALQTRPCPEGSAEDNSAAEAEKSAVKALHRRLQSLKDLDPDV